MKLDHLMFLIMQKRDGPQALSELVCGKAHTIGADLEGLMSPGQWRAIIDGAVRHQGTGNGPANLHVSSGTTMSWRSDASVVSAPSCQCKSTAPFSSDGLRPGPARTARAGCGRTVGRAV